MEPIRISDRIYHYPAIETPLAADVGVVEGDTYTWLFDLGPHTAAIQALQSLRTPQAPDPAKPICLALSHFHQDHIAGFDQLTLHELYVGKHTYNYTHRGIVVESDLYIDDGVKIHFFPLPSTHAKGSLGMEVDETYAFLGDGIYPMQKNGQALYNANLLADQLRVLRSLKAKYFLLSHDDPFVHRKEEVIAELEAIYAKRQPQSIYIEV